MTSGSVAYLVTPKIKEVDVCEKSLASEKKNAEETVMSIREGNFQPNPGENCSRCDQRPICKWSI